MPAPPSHVRAERAHSVAAAAAAHEARGPVLTSRAGRAVLLKEAWLASPRPQLSWAVSGQLAGEEGRVGLNEGFIRWALPLPSRRSP